MNKYSDTTREFALSLDHDDPLRTYRDRFVIADPDEIYLDGNSLGRLPAKTVRMMREVVENEWGEGLIRSWNTRWLERQRQAGELLAGILGAGKGDLVVTDSTSVNLFKLVCAALRAFPGRDTIVSDVLNFPSDLYILQGIIRLLGSSHRLNLVSSADGKVTEPGALEKCLDDRTALLTLSHVAFKTAFLYDMPTMTRMAQQAGAMVLWDLSHSAGVVPVNLRESGVDMAVGCTYKYLNGGPGAPAFLYISQEMREKLDPPIQGWFGDKDPFAFNLAYQPAADSQRFVPGTPGILSLSALIPALELVKEAGVKLIREKSIHQVAYLEFLYHTWLEPLGFTIGTTSDPERRGSHIALRHPEAYRICQALIYPDEGQVRVVPDFRDPDYIRLGIAPLYTSFDDIYRAMVRLLETVAHGRFKKFSARRDRVT